MFGDVIVDASLEESLFFVSVDEAILDLQTTFLVAFAVDYCY